MYFYTLKLEVYSRFMKGSQSLTPFSKSFHLSVGKRFTGDAAACNSQEVPDIGHKCINAMCWAPVQK